MTIFNLLIAIPPKTCKNQSPMINDINNIAYFAKKYNISQMQKTQNFGTSIYAIEFLSKWLNDISNVSDMKMETKVIKGKNVNTSNKELQDCLKNGGVAIFSVWETEEHYVLCTNIDDKYAYIFDP